MSGLERKRKAAARRQPGADDRQAVPGERRQGGPRGDSPDGGQLGRLISRVLSSHPAFAANPIGDWSEIVGEQVARYSQPHSLKAKVLVVTAFDSVWKHHLMLHAEHLLARINEKQAEPVVEKLVVRVGPVPEQAPVLNPNYRLLEKLAPKRGRSRKRKAAPAVKLSTEEKALLDALPDPELRAIGARLLKRLPRDQQP
jgi:hypothetical protein